MINCCDRGETLRKAPVNHGWGHPISAVFGLRYSCAVSCGGRDSGRRWDVRADGWGSGDDRHSGIRGRWGLLKQIRPGERCAVPSLSWPA
ncbi:hypothetical protein BRADO3821 [Bradyrhizobium sp. ORS 278]|nr:hypothetical protein BRADO3821 [Bradyrhizobium sp. ORS 278]